MNGKCYNPAHGRIIDDLGVRKLPLTAEEELLKLSCVADHALQTKWGGQLT